MRVDYRFVAGLAALVIACGGSGAGPSDATADAPPGAEDDAGDSGTDASIATGGGGPDATEDTAPGVADTGVDSGVGDGDAPDATSSEAGDAAIDISVIDAAADAPLEASEASSSSDLPLGSNCTTNADCASDKCLPVVPGAPSLCVAPCTAQSDCVASAGFFCDPVTGGAANGYCVPHSPVSCASCASNTDCGSLSESCFQAPTDTALACHVDCSLAGAAACPPDYTCTDETVNGNARKLCRPTAVPTCNDALGGYCDRITAPEACKRTNAAGVCNGARTCDVATSRFQACSAAAPACKTDCTVQDPAGCTESYCAAAVNTASNCATCGNVCPGFTKAHDNVTCQGSATCTFSCQGENYDVDGTASTGCEASDTPTANHTMGAAVDVGSLSCFDTTSNPNITGTLLSDTHVHENPAINGFDATSGSAPDWYKIEAVGGATCVDDVVLTLVVTGASNPACYKLTVITNLNTYTVQTDGTGTASINHSSGQYTDGSTIDIEVQKTCTPPVDEKVTYGVTGHL